MNLENRQQPTAQELADYQAALAQLMARCLESVRAADLPMDAEPVLRREIP